MRVSQCCGLSRDNHVLLFRVLASAGQNVADLQRYNLECDDPLTYACASLKWRHIAPTTPDTLRKFVKLMLLQIPLNRVLCIPR